MTAPGWFTREEMGGWEPTPPDPQARRSRRVLAVTASILLALVFSVVGWLIYVSIEQSSPTDIRNVISAPAARSLALHTLADAKTRHLYQLESITLTRNHLFWLTVWLRTGSSTRSCVAVGQALHLPTPGPGRGVTGGPQTPVAEVVPCQRWLALTR